MTIENLADRWMIREDGFILQVTTVDLEEYEYDARPLSRLLAELTSIKEGLEDTKVTFYSTIRTVNSHLEITGWRAPTATEAEAIARTRISLLEKQETERLIKEKLAADLETKEKEELKRLKEKYET